MKTTRKKLHTFVHGLINQSRDMLLSGRIYIAHVSCHQLPLLKIHLVLYSHTDLWHSTRHWILLSTL